MAAPVSYSGFKPGHVNRANTFDWIFGDPFQNENAHTPPERRLPKIDDDRPIFVDNKSGKERLGRCDARGGDETGKREIEGAKARVEI